MCWRSLEYVHYGFKQATYTVTADTVQVLAEAGLTVDISDEVGVLYGDDLAFKNKMKGLLGSEYPAFESALIEIQFP